MLDIEHALSAMPREHKAAFVRRWIADLEATLRLPLEQRADEGDTDEYLGATIGKLRGWLAKYEVVPTDGRN